MEEIRDQMELANEISDVISQPVGFGIDMDEVRTMAHRRATTLLGCHVAFLCHLCKVLSVLLWLMALTLSFSCRF